MNKLTGNIIEKKLYTHVFGLLILLVIVFVNVKDLIVNSPFIFSDTALVNAKITKVEEIDYRRKHYQYEFMTDGQLIKSEFFCKNYRRKNTILRPIMRNSCPRSSFSHTPRPANVPDYVMYTNSDRVDIEYLLSSPSINRIATNKNDNPVVLSLVLVVATSFFAILLIWYIARVKP